MSERKQMLAATIVAAIAVLGLAAVSTAADDEKEVDNAFAVQMVQGMSGTIEINITRWSTPEQRNMLLTTLMEKGHDDFMKALRKQDETGFVQGQGALARANPFPSTRLHAAWQSEKDGKRKVVLVTDRPIGMREASSVNRSLDYDTSVIIMEFPANDPSADGTGTLHMALKLGYDEKKNTLEVEELGQQPVRLTKITKKD